MGARKGMLLSAASPVRRGDARGRRGWKEIAQGRKRERRQKTGETS